MADPSVDARFEAHRERMDRLETLVKELESVRREDLQQFRAELRQEVRAVGSKVEQVILTVAARRECPDPGRCLVLGDEVKRNEQRIRALEREGDKLQGGLTGWRLMGAIVLAAITSGASIAGIAAFFLKLPSS